MELFFFHLKKARVQSFTKTKRRENSIEWKVNRGVFFSRLENHSWHSFNNGENGVRRVLIYNLMTYDVKRVCEIEKSESSFCKIQTLSKSLPL